MAKIAVLSLLKIANINFLCHNVKIANWTSQDCIVWFSVHIMYLFAYRLQFLGDTITGVPSPDYQ